MPKNHDIYYVTKYKVQEGNACLQSTKFKKVIHVYKVPKFKESQYITK